MNQMTFQSLCKRLRDKPSFGSHVEVLNTLIGAAECLIEGPQTGGAAALITALAEKEKLINLVKTVVDTVFDQKLPGDYSGRVEQMEEAYGTIYFTAFFDELDRWLPDSIRKSIQLSLRERLDLFESSLSPGGREHSDRREVVFPDIVRGCKAVDGELLSMYRVMAGRLRGFLKGLSFWDVADEKTLASLERVMEELPCAAVKRFHDQYLALCCRFNEFCIYAQMERETEREIKWDARYQELLSAAARRQDLAEEGLAGLKKAVTGLPVQIKKEKVREIVDGLVRTYRGEIERPLIETKDDEEKLTYPLISKAFIPQSYKLLRYSGEERLERKETWEELGAEQNMESFWAKYCLDPGSVENLLLILGEPGGGKSLLTKIFCARMIDPSNICVRIPLREYDMEEEIESIIRKRIAKDGDASEPLPTFKWFAEEFPESPITLLFDGYDEVMQATGGIYRNLLMKIRQFQDRCREQRRPVRIVVTSRETLIDKADIPKKTMVMKLLEFDGPRKERWIKIWNAHNHEALAGAGIQDFALPDRNPDIEALSGQPLLLTMLAIYDANFEKGTNALRQEDSQAKTLDRTRLYDELLRRFIRRELRKGPRGEGSSYEGADPEEQNAMVDEEMKKLGIAALGMFVREKLSLKVGELEDDLAHMKAETVSYSSRNRKMLKNAEAVFGSFFFIHDSRMEDEDDEKEAAFEFLHKTFYEFLAADLILQYLIDAADKINGQRRSTKRGEDYYRDALGKPDFLDPAYYAALNSACLCTEPEIIRMIAEWKDGKLRHYFQEECPDLGGGMAQVLADLFDKHAEIIRTGIFTPFVERRGGLADGKPYPQACAVYLMNLIILRIVTGGECRIKSGEWDYISQFLKLNIPLSSEKPEEEPKRGGARRKLKIDPYEEMVLKFMALFRVRREDGDIVLTKKAWAGRLERETLQEARMDAFDFVQDDVTWRLYRLHDRDVNLEFKQLCRRELKKQGFDFGLELAVAEMYEALRGNPGRYDLGRMIEFGVNCLDQDHADESLVLDWLLCVRLLAVRPKERDMLRWSLGIWSILTDIIFRRYLNEREIVLVLLELIKTLDCGEVLLNLGESRIEKAIECWSRISLNLVEAFIEAIPWGATKDEKIFIHQLSSSGYQERMSFSSYDLRKICAHVDSPRAAAALLDLLYKRGEVSSSDPIVRDIQEKWVWYFRNTPEELPRLLRVYLQMGKFEEVKEFIQRVGRKVTWIFEMWNRSPESVNELLDIAQTVGEGREFSGCVAHCESTDRNIALGNIRAIMPLVRGSVSVGSGRVNKNRWVLCFLDKYDMFFESDPEEAVCLLAQMVSREDSFDWDEPLSKAWTYSLQYYGFLLGISVMAAACLLTAYERIKRQSALRYGYIVEPDFTGNRRLTFRRPLAFYAKRCFNKAMSTGDRAGVGPLAEFLDNMGRDTKKAMMEYFEEQLPYLQIYSEKLAEKVREMYGFFWREPLNPLF